jgi:radical SAM superfamily enzyme YgiQ (UPF0313 family)
VDEIETLVERFGLSSFFIADDTFTLQPGRAATVCGLIVQRRLPVTWACEARVNTMTAELARQLREAGCIEVQYGVETGNPEIMKLIRKGIKLEQVEQAVVHAVTAGLDVICSFIVGLPWDTWDTVHQTIALAQRLCQLGSPQPNRGGKGRGRVTAVYSPLTPLPGTLVYQEADALGLRFLTRDWDRFTFNSPVVETAQFSAAAVRQALYGAVSYAQSPC